VLEKSTRWRDDGLARPLVLVGGEVVRANVFCGHAGFKGDPKCERVARVTAHLERVHDVDALRAK
jgi:hypothetical protein